MHALDREPSALVEPTSVHLRARGLTVARRPVDYEFQPGATEVLVVSGVAGFAGQ
ncbi:hypothetical protein EGH22_07785 [Halomicroarcula sp. F28]|uniref:hypothetical protein n=1 Tax=Haloarcula salinisoli TaxID=2487746 RepID=UPI001C730170|nr:hypothetical protein [Halomicroarcula salinisoli]MBX0286223.1 hypothetical protein [Halomicroarcula salinisoli]